MKNELISRLVSMLLGLLTPSLVREVVDKLLDIVEDAVLRSEGELDDRLVLPLIALIREALNVPDND